MFKFLYTTQKFHTNENILKSILFLDFFMTKMKKSI